MDLNLIIILIVIAGLFGALIFFLKSQLSALTEKKADPEKDALFKQMMEMVQNNQNSMQTILSERLREVNVKMEFLQGSMTDNIKHMQNQLSNTTENLARRSDENSKTLNVRLDKAAEVISNVQKELGSMSEIGRNMKDLQDFLKSPKLRGNIGEEVLKDLLEQMIPSENYTLQYAFKSGEKVDAVLKIEGGLICVDSKFPFENFNLFMQTEKDEDRTAAKKDFHRDVKKHIDSIAKKYILPDEKTLEFALMYIPSEAIYYEVVVNNHELGKYAWSKRVLPVSPNVFYSYLRAILIGLEGKKVESRAKEILSAIRAIKEDSGKFSDSLKTLSSHLNNAKNKADEVSKHFEKLDDKLSSLSKLPDKAITAPDPLDESLEQKLL
jgi:DNA recombination protein RmuC